MVGILTVKRKPGRSEEDEIISENEGQRKTEEVRCYFESMAPIRPLKPNRSEPASMDHPPPFSGEIPELMKLHSLFISHSSPSTIVRCGDPEADEFVETEYYQHIDSIDKLHHRTGTGFIDAWEKEEEEEGCLGLRSEQSIYGRRGGVFRGNPARNDWIPAEEEVNLVTRSSKPNRSEC